MPETDAHAPTTSVLVRAPTLSKRDRGVDASGLYSGLDVPINRNLYGRHTAAATAVCPLLAEPARPGVPEGVRSGGVRQPGADRDTPLTNRRS